jgi:hypothetical protein
MARMVQFVLAFFYYFALATADSDCKSGHVLYINVSGKAIWIMTTTIKYKDWDLTFDKGATRIAYDNWESGSAESCNCNDCKNFADNRDNLYPDEVKRLFDQLGIDYKKETEIIHYGRQKDGLHYYGGWFHFKGQFKGKDCTVPLPSGGHTLELTPVTDNFSIGFRADNSLTIFSDNEGLVQIEFESKIPWTIDKGLEVKD